MNNFDKFVISAYQNQAVQNQLALQEVNGWFSAYKDVRGDTAYKEGVITGGNNCYVDAIYDLKRYIKSLVNEEPDLKASKLIDLIVNTNKK
jgi:hypothetical protein